MGIEIKLDTNALDSLIKSDPEFKLQIQQAVLQNIADRHVKNVGYSLESVLERCLRNAEDDLRKQFLEKTGPDGKMSLRQDFLAKFQKTCKDSVELTLAQALTTCKTEIDSQIREHIRQLNPAWIQKRIESEVEAISVKAIKEAVTERVEKALASL